MTVSNHMERVYIGEISVYDIDLRYSSKKCLFEYFDSIFFLNPTSKLGLKCSNRKFVLGSNFMQLPVYFLNDKTEFMFTSETRIFPSKPTLT